MSNTFSGLDLGRRALYYFKQGIITAGHNISNADRDGYSRQRVTASASPPYSAPGLDSSGEAGQIGTGVDIDSISRIRDAFLDYQYRQESGENGFWKVASQTMKYVEMYINEPSKNAIAGALGKISDALQELQKRPDISSMRESFVSQMDNFCTLVNQVYKNMSEYRTSLNNEVKTKVEEANTLIDRISALNTQIKVVMGTGDNPNDAMDERDLLVDKLSNLLDISIDDEGNTGGINISLGGRLLVQGERTRHLVLVKEKGNDGFYDVQVEGNEFDSTTDPGTATASIGREAEEGVHSVLVSRSASETRWAIGNGYSTGISGSTDAALGIDGSFSIQVGTNGFKAISSSLSGGDLLDAPSGNDHTEYSFRMAAGSDEQVVDVKWNDATSTWEINGTDTGKGKLNISDLANAVNGMSSDIRASVDAAGEKITFYNKDGHLISLTDLKGDLVGSVMGLKKTAPTVDIEVTANDSLQTIANKINSAYMASNGSPDSPEEWLHASIAETRDGSLCLVLESNEVGENYRINIGPADSGSLGTAEKLGLVNTNSTTKNMQYSQDALFKVDGMQYLSSSSSFSEARLVTAFNSYKANTMQTVIKDVTLNITKGASGSSTDIVIGRHVDGGYIGGLLQSRDDLVTGTMNFLNEFALSVSDQFNAIHYSGYGAGNYSNTTGTALFDPLSSLDGAAGSLSINSKVIDEKNLVATAGDDGSGHNIGNADASKVLKMIALFSNPVFDGRSASINEYYSSFVSSIGSHSQQARVMNSNQETLIDQISAQRQSVSGVNTDEETMDMIQFQQSYQAIARYISVLDEMLDKVINGMGTVGR